MKEKAIELFNEILTEVVSSDEKYGQLLDTPSLDTVLLNRKDNDSKRMAEEYEMPTANRATFICVSAFNKGELTHAHTAVENLAKAIRCMENEEQMRRELILLAVNTIKWIRSIDSRNHKST